MSSIDNQPEQVVVPINEEKPFVSTDSDQMWDGPGLIMAIAVVAALIVIGVVVERGLNYWAPIKSVPTSGAVIGQPAHPPGPSSAVGAVYVPWSPDFHQARNPLPAGQIPGK